MANRRQFLKIGIASSSIPLAASAVKANTLRAFFSDATEESIPFYKILADSRYPESMRFADEMHARGFDIHVLEDGDPTVFWNEELREIWETMPVALAGVTNFRPMFVLQQLGRTHGTRVVYRGVHDYVANGEVNHQVEGPSKMLSQYQDRVDFKSESRAGHSLADLIMSCESGRNEIVSLDFAERTGHNRVIADYANAEYMRTSYSGLSNLKVDPQADKLNSWIVAPAHRA
tara:strand:+ start:69935 stop:70630 length:696 start_codon:yes stop_codon:yes gene_type:complete